MVNGVTNLKEWIVNKRWNRIYKLVLPYDIFHYFRDFPIIIFISNKNALEVWYLELKI